MARLPRLCIPGRPHLLLQRGHNRQAVFVDDADRARFRDLLQQAATRHGVQIHAYGLFDDEVRLLVTPAAPDSLSLLMQAIGRRYVAAFNRRHGRSGALWEGRFRTTVIEPRQHLLACMLYAEGLGGGWADSAVRPGWSSAEHHLGMRADPLISEPAAFWELGNTPFDREAAYRRKSEQALTEKELAAIVGALQAGWPLGSPEFVAALGSETTRRVQPLRRGRPRKLM